MVASARPQRFVGGAALTVIALLGAWTMCANLTGINGSVPVDLAGSDDDQSPGQTEITTPRGDKLAIARGDKLAIARPAVRAVEDATAFLFSPRFLGLPNATFARLEAALPRPSRTTVAEAELPPLPPARPRPAEQSIAAAQPPLLLTAPARNTALAEHPRAPRAVADASAQQPSLFERLFGKPSRVALAYASPDTAGLDAQSIGRYDQWTAVYDISAHKVYMPDGSVLEAHSGYGNRLDDPHSASVHNLGVTPPDLYDLQPRESPFHGVQALRLIPVDEEKVFGRSGLLAHSFMLGPNGDSNGCVSFRDYEAFLRAYTNHEVKRLAVVSRLD